ncbi:50S ribosomal protein L31 [Candidatus Poribacteria bacterium]|nr:50S ribosomal protein L31 [Candidatus Poribacteria bacterium]MBM3216875.1 50S ribosomal protein L31 [Candidatus Poribacteria bacterium]
MKTGIHPNVNTVTISCVCGATYETFSTKTGLRVEVCASCHPFFTGQRKIVDTEGRVQKFEQKYRRFKAQA